MGTVTYFRWLPACFGTALAIWVASAGAVDTLQSGVRTFARFDREITTLWPGEDGQILVQVDGKTSGEKGHLWVVNREGEVTWHHDLPGGLPLSDVGWAPDRILFVRPGTDPKPAEDADVEWVLMTAPGEMRRVKVPWGYAHKVNWLSPLPVILWMGSRGVYVSDLSGRRLEGWDMPDWPWDRALVDVAVVDKRPRLAMAPNRAPPFRLVVLDATTGRTVKEWQLGAHWTGGRPCISPATGLVALFGGNERHPDGRPELRLFDLRSSAPPESFAFEEPLGFHRSLSPDGTRLALWNGPCVGVFDLQARRLQWMHSLKPRGSSYWVQGMKSDGQGAAVAVLGNHLQSAPIEVHFTDRTGRPALMWRSPGDARYSSPENGTPLVVDWAGRRALVRYRNEIVSVPLPAPREPGRETQCDPPQD